MRLFQTKSGVMTTFNIEDSVIDVKFPDGFRVDFSNISAYIYNLDIVSNLELVQDLIMTFGRSYGLLESDGYDRLVNSWYGSYSLPDIPKGLYVDENQSNATQGLYFRDYQKDVIYPVNIKPFTAGGHRTAFSWLVQKGLFSPELQFYNVQRGYTQYMANDLVYAVVGGSWLSQGIGQQVCQAFNFDYTKYPWFCGIIGAYDPVYA